jgi:glucose/arabinose dehydrogenase
MRIAQPFNNHNGGSIAFGPDGYLYIGLGDGGDRNDPLGNGLNLSTWLGSILRIDVDRQENGKPYAIPKDNPFVAIASARPEIYAYGFRNVWRLAFDSKTGDLWAGDVGQDLWEEINLVRRGGNYGWSIREGTHPFGNADQVPFSEPIEPIWEYDHGIGKSITGGRVYNSSRLPELQGMYVYADYVSGRVWALEYGHKAQKLLKHFEISPGGIPVTAFGEDANGEIYYMTAAANGQCIFRFERE